MTANKSRKIELLNSTTGVPFTNPISQFTALEFLHQQRNHPPQTTVIHTYRNLSPPLATHQDEEAAAYGDHFNSLIQTQNFLIGYHVNNFSTLNFGFLLINQSLMGLFFDGQINQMRLSVEEIWRRM
ncbi:hypothetical protein LXL04_000713 [Taraxacum kok-saghyz]